jgi:hypothetical protein
MTAVLLGNLLEAHKFCAHKEVDMNLVPDTVGSGD